MATTPRIDDTGALALRPVRVNIFARPESGERERSLIGPRAAGVFDAAAACEGLAAPVAGSWSQGRWRGAVASRWAARLVLLIAVPALIAALAAQPRDEGTVDRATSRLQRPDKPRASDRAKRRPPAARAATKRRPASKSTERHRATRRRRTSRGGPQTPHPPPLPIAPRAPQRSAPTSDAPAGPLPAPVPPDSPPEFM